MYLKGVRPIRVKRKSPDVIKNSPSSPVANLVKTLVVVINTKVKSIVLFLKKLKLQEPLIIKYRKNRNTKININSAQKKIHK